MFFKNTKTRNVASSSDLSHNLTLTHQPLKSCMYKYQHRHAQASAENLLRERAYYLHRNVNCVLHQARRRPWASLGHAHIYQSRAPTEWFEMACLTRALHPEESPSKSSTEFGSPPIS